MEIIYLLAPLTILLAAFFLVLFIKSNNDGQFEDLSSEDKKILIEDTEYKEEKIK